MRFKPVFLIFNVPQNNKRINFNMVLKLDVFSIEDLKYKCVNLIIIICENMLIKEYK